MRSDDKSSTAKFPTAILLLVVTNNFGQSARTASQIGQAGALHESVKTSTGVPLAVVLLILIKRPQCPELLFLPFILIRNCKQLSRKRSIAYFWGKWCTNIPYTGQYLYILLTSWWPFHYIMASPPYSCQPENILSCNNSPKYNS